MANIKQVLGVLCVTATSTFAWMATDYEAHVINDASVCQTVREVVADNKVTTCHDSIRIYGNFKYVAVGGWLTDYLRLDVRADEVTTPIKTEPAKLASGKAEPNKPVPMLTKETISSAEKQARAIETISDYYKFTVIAHTVAAVVFLSWATGK